MPQDSAEPVLHVDSEGRGPALVFAHGFGGSGRNFRPQVRALRDRYRVLTYDARGHSRSQAPEDPAAYTLEALVSDFARVADQALGEPVVAGGLSLGAATALGFALSHPERVRALVLAAFASGAGQVDSARRRWALGFADAIRDQGLDAAGAQFAWGERSRFDPKAGELIRRGFLEHPPHALQAILRQTLASLPSPDDLASGLRALTVPTLVIAGEEDHAVLEPSRRLVELLPNAELVVIPKAGHVVNLARPAEFNRHTSAFLDSVFG